jgi:hypothetical protein
MVCSLASGVPHSELTTLQNTVTLTAMHMDIVMPRRAARSHRGHQAARLRLRLPLPGYKHIILIILVRILLLLYMDIPLQLVHPLSKLPKNWRRASQIHLVQLGGLGKAEITTGPALTAMYNPFASPLR